MPATPAWPPKSTPRLYLDQRLDVGATIELDHGQTRYLLGVMRRSDGDVVRLFDDTTGEYVARIAAAGGGRCLATVEEKLAPREEVPDLWLCVSPLQRDNFALVAEKACELGVRRFVPVEMRRSVVRKINEARLRKRIIEAAEQCERTALPELATMTKLDRLVQNWPVDRSLFFADELGGETPAESLVNHSGPAALLIGPEGGFDYVERAAIRALPQARPISLGPRILRAETAAIAATALWMAFAGDWRN
ncbi:16S rRNA (uracil(1498)-N(3))-methyltransferase [Pelagerythrobacter rhizovicinus]|uniref:Ribosomal RNA small subunit methyltransferase E n=1 Tax=Pelagerythrobacter rhizovicinus TaxID=2268576 RepID=A0A4Q2KNJ7_9SPHN|nr:16S rRNA (uracil(1498)-N(3))-methyltransferase [Pelagerythrobacter rhizovicinus]RXZ66017.1 16S rRNA (uracil(1498)-N(3))-methyltransferase [Pelagerythrobacter rhizovicinus]